MPDDPEPEGEVMAAKFEIIKDHAGKFRFHLKAPNGEIIAASPRSSPPVRDTRQRPMQRRASRRSRRTLPTPR
jgi:hypothetical protein